jgi:exonuclease SbcC
MRACANSNPICNRRVIAPRARQAAEGCTQPNLAQLREVLALARTRVEESVQRESVLLEQQSNLEQILGSLKRVNDTIEKLKKEYGIVRRLANVASGKNKLKMPFQRFVLAAKMEEVLLNASRRLLKMSRGRYLLKRADLPAGRQHTGGLELEVCDTWTGETTRPVKTLSGGESFLASLALALGLADVVQAYSGGIHLDTIFIDEGFGALDSEKLDRAIQTLESLKEGKRLVGIISHVDGLRERIPTRLEVSAGTQGSTARFVVG